MSPRTERRGRRTSGNGRAASSSGKMEVTSSPCNQTLANDGGAILKEFLPESASTDPKFCRSSAPAVGRAPQLHQLIGAIPSPARSSAVPPPPAHAPSMPPAAAGSPPMAPQTAPTEVGAGCQWGEVQRGGHMPMPAEMGGACGSYRERLRAGGRGALQRAFDSGLVPKNMKQDWNGMQSPTSQMSNSGGMAFYTNAVDNQQVWNGGVSDYWCMPTDQTQMASQMPYMQQMGPMTSMQQQPMSTTPLLQQAAPLQLGPPASMPVAPPATSALMLPQGALMSGPTSGASDLQDVTPHSDSTPEEIDRCKAIIMPNFDAYDPEAMAAQLRAVAYGQTYED